MDPRLIFVAAGGDCEATTDERRGRGTMERDQSPPSTVSLHERPVDSTLHRTDTRHLLDDERTPARHGTTRARARKR